MCLLNGNKLLLIVSGIWICFLASARENETVYRKVEAVFESESVKAPFLEEVLASAKRRDPRFERIAAQIDSVSAASRAGKSWPNPELRFGYEDDKGDSETGIGLRIRFPNGTSSRVIEQTAAVELTRLSKRELAIEESILLEMRKATVLGAMAKANLTIELKNCNRQEALLEELASAGPQSLLSEAKQKRKLRSSHRRLKKAYLRYRESLLYFQSFGLSTQKAAALVASEDLGAYRGMYVDQGLDLIESKAIDLSEEVTDRKRDEDLVLVQQEAGGKQWFLVPTFAQFGWDEDKDGLLRGDSGDFQIRAGVELNLFDAGKKQELEALRHEAVLATAEARSRVLNDVRSAHLIWCELHSWYAETKPEREASLENLLTLLRNLETQAVSMNRRMDLYEEIYYIRRSELEELEDLVLAYFELCETVGRVL